MQAPAPKAVTSSQSGNGTQAAAPPAPKAAAPATAAAGPTRSADASAGQHAAPGQPDSQPQQGGVTKQSAGAKTGKDDEEWWTV